MKRRRLIGLMSGTSADGVDAALVSIAAGRSGVSVDAFVSIPYPSALRTRVLAVAGGAAVGAGELATLDADLGEIFAKSALALCRRAGVAPSAIRAIGSHGQTVHHAPRAKRPVTMQLGDSSIIAERTGITTVADFRRRDVAAGGEGAPLVPHAHVALFGGNGSALAVQNLGGIGNVTVIPAHRNGDVFAFDTGPANIVLDAIVREMSDGRKRFDRGGAMSRAGEPDERMLTRLLAAPFFGERPPKSTGREAFGRAYVGKILDEGRRRRLAPSDLLATAAELTARSIGQAFERFVLPKVAVTEALLCGGGVHNRDVARRITRELAALGIETRSTAERGIDPDAVEAIAFALLADDTLDGRPGNVPRATGARGPRVLGVIVPGARRLATF